MNIVAVTGRLTKEPEISYLQDGKAVGRLSLAVDDGWGDKKHTSFFEVTAFGKTAENVSSQPKGNKLGVTGRLQQDRWETQDGTKKSKVKIIASNVEFLSPRQAEASQSEAQQPQVGDAPSGDDFVIPGEQEMF